MANRVRVLIEQTGVETVVSREYYDKYASEGVRWLGEVIPESPVEKVVGPPVRLDDPMPRAYKDMSWDELKDACTLKGMTFAGNASKKELLKMLEE